MKFIKLLFLFLTLVSLNGCIQSTALLGPAITAATTGNIYHASLQYGANTAIKQETGKDAFAHLKNIVEKEQENKKFKIKLKKIVENIINKTKVKLSTN